MRVRTEVINYLIKKYGYTSYLEIGIEYAKNWDAVECKQKTGVDPRPMVERTGVLRLTSDQFFAKNTDKYDLIFIDGSHDYKQVTKDILNALDVLNENGRIVCHDTLPYNEQYTDICGNGTVYRAVADVLKMGIVDVTTWNHDHGCAVLKKGNTARTETVISYNDYLSNKHIYNIVDELDDVQ